MEIGETEDEKDMYIPPMIIQDQLNQMTGSKPNRWNAQKDIQYGWKVWKIIEEFEKWLFHLNSNCDLSFGIYQIVRGSNTSDFHPSKSKAKRDVV